MYNEEEIEDSLEFCRQIKMYYETGEKEEKQEEKEENHSVYEKESPPVKKQNHTLDELSNEPLLSKKKKKESAAFHFVSNMIMLGVCILMSYCLASVTAHYVAHRTMVEGESMEPSLSDGDSIIIQKISYYLGDPERFDVVVFPVNHKSGQSEKTYYVKRVIGLPGETVQIQKGKVYINGKRLKGDDYCLSDSLNPGKAAEPIVLGKDEYFVLGDNRNRSTDSRSDYVGLIRKKDIMGEVLFRIWPITHIGRIPK